MKHRNFDFVLFLGGGGGDSYLRSDFLEGRVKKISNFALKIKGGGREGGTSEVLRPCHPPKFGTCTRHFLEGGGGGGRESDDQMIVTFS